MVFYQVVRKGLSAEVTFEWKPERNEEESHTDFDRKNISRQRE